MAAADSQKLGSAPPLLGPPFTRLPPWAKLATGIIAAGAMVLAGYAASREYPHSTRSPQAELERRVAEVHHDPTVSSWDEAVVGDLLVERFYILDTTTGEHYISDFLKGRITGIEVVQREDEPAQDVLLLDTRDMRRDRVFYSAYISTVSHPDQKADGFYLGVITPTGDRDAFPVNYNGELPAARADFRVGEQTDVYDYMLKLTYKDIASPRPITVAGYNFVLSTSDVFPLFKNEYRMDKAMFVSELLVVDTTSKPNRNVYFRLLDKYPRINTAP